MVFVWLAISIQSNIWMKVLDALHSWQFYKWSEITCLLYKQHLQELSKEHEWEMDTTIFPILWKNARFFHRRANIQMSMEETVAAFSRQSKKQQWNNSFY